jgi:hypothetical protein
MKNTKVNPWISHLRVQAKKMKVKYNDILKNPELLAQVKASYAKHKMEGKR